MGEVEETDLSALRSLNGSVALLFTALQDLKASLDASKLGGSSGVDSGDSFLGGFGSGGGRGAHSLVVSPATVPLILKAGTCAQTTQQALAHLSKLLPEGGGLGGVAGNAFSPDAILDLIGSLKVCTKIINIPRMPLFLLIGGLHYIYVLLILRSNACFGVYTPIHASTMLVSVMWLTDPPTIVSSPAFVFIIGESRWSEWHHETEFCTYARAAEGCIWRRTVHRDRNGRQYDRLHVHPTRCAQQRLPHKGIRTRLAPHTSRTQ
jgi:hypothetical protein